MTKLYIFNEAATKLITSAGALALIAGLSLTIAPQAYAYDCLLDTNNDGDADSNVDTDGSADSSGNAFRLACGQNATAGGNRATAFGRAANAAVNYTTALGSSAVATGENSTAVGYLTIAAGVDATALGREANAAGPSSTALGKSANAGGSGSTAVGFDTSAGGSSSIAFGNFANAAGHQSISIGGSTDAAGQFSTVLGWGANSGVTSGAFSIAHGSRARSEGINAIAIGADTNDAGSVGADAQGADSIVIGADASDGAFADAIVIGAGASATESDQVILKSADTFTILGNGDVGIGTAAPLGNLDVNSGVDDTYLLLSNDAAVWEIKSNATNGKMTIGNNTTGAKPFKFGPDAIGNLLQVGIVATDQVDIKGDLVLIGTLTTGGPTCGGGCDAVFGADYDLPSIEEHAAAMYANSYLPEIGPTVPHAPVNLSEQYGKVINELEKAHIYIAQQDTKLKQQEMRLNQQSAELKLIKQQIADFINP